MTDCEICRNSMHGVDKADTSLIVKDPMDDSENDIELCGFHCQVLLGNEPGVSNY